MLNLIFLYYRTSHHYFVIFRKLLLCRVVLGKPVEQYTAIRIAHAPPGHHSVIGRPSAGGLNYPEYVIYRGEQVHIVLIPIVDNLFYIGISRISHYISH